MQEYPRDIPGPTGPYRIPSNATLILVLGILTWVVCGLLGPAAWYMGNQTLSLMRRGYMDAEERGLARAGQMLGMIYTCLVGGGVLVVLVMLALKQLGAFPRF